MDRKTSLSRFTEAQELSYQTALAEIKNGRKQSHWMWYIFPQIRGLGFSQTSIFFGIKDLSEAVEFLKHPVLGTRLVAISNELLALDSNDATKIFGSPDDVKLKSCMTLFSSLPDTNPVFVAVLKKFFNGSKDNRTLQLIGE